MILRILLLCAAVSLALSLPSLEDGPYANWELRNSSSLDLDDGAEIGSKKCNCAHPECEFPKTAKDCAKCGSHGAEKTSFDEGKCWIKVGNLSPMECASKCTRNFLDCTGFAGVHHYSASKSCWCYYHKPAIEAV